MKQSISFLIVFILSCQKPNINIPSPYYINLTIDGVSKSFNGDAGAEVTIKDSVFNFTIYGHPDPYNGAEVLSMTIINRPGYRPLVPGTYSQLDSAFTIKGLYTPSNGLAAFNVGGDYPILPDPLKITISSLDSNTVRGSFSGTFYILRISEKKTLKGEFYLSMKYYHL
jgi:hypothetical protein